MNNKLFRVVTPKEWGLIVDSRIVRAIRKLTKNPSKPVEIIHSGEPSHTITKPIPFPLGDVDYESKQFHGAYADDERECNHSIINMGVCVGCGERVNDQ